MGVAEALPISSVPAPQNDSLGPGNCENVKAGLGEVKSLRLPSGVIDRQLIRGSTPPFFNRRTTGQAFEAIAMERTDTLKVIVRMPGSPHVAHFRMPRSLHQRAVRLR